MWFWSALMLSWPQKGLPLCFHTHSFTLEKEETGKSNTMVDKERREKKCREAGNFLKVYVKDIPGLRTHLSPNVPMSKDWMTCPSPSSWRVMYQGQRTGQTGSKASSSFALWRALTKYTWFSSLGRDGIGVREGLLHFWVFRERRDQLNIFQWFLIKDYEF